MLFLGFLKLPNFDDFHFSSGMVSDKISDWKIKLTLYGRVINEPTIGKDSVTSSRPAR